MTSDQGRILIVDDEADFRTVLRLVLTNAGYDVVEAPSGARAIEQLDEGPFDVVVLDVFMPEMSGFDVARSIAVHADRPSVIFLTAAGEPQFHQEGAKLGAFAYLHKPLDIDRLLTAVRDALALGADRRAGSKG